MTDWDESSLQAALAEALEEKEKAAEYGLQLLHRNTHLEHCKEQLEGQVAQLKTSYDDLKQTHGQLSETHSRMYKSLDLHDQSILSESEDREINLMEERDQLRSQVKRRTKTEKRMKNKISELTGQVDFLNDEIERHKMTNRTHSEQIRALRAKEKNLEKDYSDVVEETCNLQKEVSELRQRENKTTGLIELNESLKNSYEQKRQELHDVQQIYLDTKSEYKQILAALEAEREAREMYQIKLEDSIRSDTDEDNCDIPTKMMGSPQMLHSPPLSSVAHELAAELEESIHLSVVDLEEKLESVNSEKSRLSEVVEQHRKELSNSQKLLTIKDEEVKQLECTLKENIKQLGEKEEIEMRFYVIQEAHQNMINDLSTDIIKLKHSNNSLKTAEFLSHETIMHLKSDMDTMETRYFESNSQGLINDLRNELHILRDRERVLLQTITSLKSDLSRENDEKLTCMYIELHTLFKDLCILRRFSSSHKQEEPADNEEHWLLGQHINTDKVVALLKEQVSQLKSTINSILMTQVLDTGLIQTEDDLESFKQIILLQNTEQKSLAQVQSQYERDMSMLRENNTELRCRNKQLERDKLEWESLRKVFDMKCEEYIVEVGIMEKRLRESERERNTLQGLLQKIIQDKIELKQKIESFEIDMESSSVWSKNNSLYAKFDLGNCSATNSTGSCSDLQEAGTSNTL